MCFQCLLNFLTHPYIIISLLIHPQLLLLLLRSFTVFDGIKSWIKLKALKRVDAGCFCAKKFIMFLYHMVITLYRSPFTPENTTTSPIQHTQNFVYWKLKFHVVVSQRFSSFYTVKWRVVRVDWKTENFHSFNIKKGVESEFRGNI